jgi:hypothetical protein
MTKPVICCDFDGTLVDERGWIHPRDREILLHERRVHLIPATARLLPALRAGLNRHGLFVDEALPFPLILMNGAALYDAGEELVAQHPFPLAVQKHLVEAMFDYTAVTYFAFTLDAVHVLYATSRHLEMAERYDLNMRPFTEESREERFAKVSALAEDRDAIQGFADKIAGLGLETSFSVSTAMEVNQTGVDKGRGLAELLEILGLGSAPLAVAGDGGNDLPLFELAELSFAPHDSPEEVRSKASRLLHVEETGVLMPILQELGIEP